MVFSQNNRQAGGAPCVSAPYQGGICLQLPFSGSHGKSLTDPNGLRAILLRQDTGATNMRAEGVRYPCRVAQGFLTPITPSVTPISGTSPPRPDPFAHAHSPFQAVPAPFHRDRLWFQPQGNG